MALPYIVEQLGKEKYSEPLTQNSNIFSVGTGKDSNGNDVDISSSIVNAQVSDIVIKGNTRANLSSKYAHSTNSSDKTMSINLVAGKTYTLSAFIDTTNTVDLSRIRIQDDVPNYYVGNGVSGNSKGYSVVTFTPVNSGLHHVYCQKLYTADSNSAVFSEIMLEEANERKHFITGTKSTVNALRIKSIAPNNLETKEKLISSGDNVYGDFIAVEPNKPIYLKQSVTPTGAHRPIFRVYDSSRNEITTGVSVSTYDGFVFVYFNGRWATGADSVGQKNSLITINANANIRFVEFGLFRSAEATDRLVSQVATEYEPYKLSQAYINAGGELRSVGVVKDEIRDIS